MVGLIMFCPSAALRKWSYNTTGYLISFIKNDIAHWDVFWPFVCHWYQLRFLNIILFCNWEEFKAALIPSLYQAERDTSSHVWIFCHLPSEGRKGSCYLMVFFKAFFSGTPKAQSKREREATCERRNMTRTFCSSPEVYVEKMSWFHKFIICGYVSCHLWLRTILETLEVLSSMENDGGWHLIR